MSLELVVRCHAFFDTVNSWVSLSTGRLLAFLPFLIACLGWGFAYYGNFYCDNVQFEPSTGPGDATDFSAPRTQSYGLFFYRWHQVSQELDGLEYLREGCVNYDKGHPFFRPLDPLWKTARAFACIATIVAGFLLFWSFCAPLLLLDQLFWRWGMALYVVCALCQAVTLTFLWSNACVDSPLLTLHVPDPTIYPDTCAWDTGMYCSVVGAALYLLAAVSMVFIPAPGYRPDEPGFPVMVWDDVDDAPYDDHDDDLLRKPLDPTETEDHLDEEAV